MNAEAVATVLGVGLVGLEGHLVEVETHVGRGLVAFTLVGLPDASLREARERVRSALQSCRIETLDQHTTVNLSPAGLPKTGSGFDLAIAVSVLMANGKVSPGAAQGTVFLAELGLDGTLRPLPGVLPSLMACASRGVDRAVVPARCLDEARLVPGIEVVGFEHLADVVTWAKGSAGRAPSLGAHVPDRGAAAAAATRPRVPGPDLGDVRGQQEARHALEVAAAGGHHLFLVGEPGSGKTMLASRLTTILPALDDRTAITVTALHSVAGVLDPSEGLIRRPPLETPHHSATMPALIGGGGGMPRPGAVSLAHGGVLVLDEAAEFAPSVLDALRQPLEQGVVTIHRSRATAHYPAAFQLVLASNPCPCGGEESAVHTCTCTSLQRRRYMSRLSGPLLDRIDIRVGMRRPSRADLATERIEPSHVVRERVVEARSRAGARLRGTPWTLNCQLPGGWIRERSGVDGPLLAEIDRSVDRGVLTLRGADRVLRLSWTLADLDGRDRPDGTDVARALALRNGGVHAWIG